MKPQGNRDLYALLTTFAIARKNNERASFATHEVIPYVTAAGFRSTKAKNIEEMVYIHLNDLTQRLGVLKSAPFDGRTRIVERLWQLA